MLETVLTTQPAGMSGHLPKPDTLRARAVALEAFLFEEMLRVSGTGTPSAAGPGGDSQFESFLRRAQAEAIAGSGQTGLADSIHEALLRSVGPAGT
jgi:hypothetical protein